MFRGASLFLTAVSLRSRTARTAGFEGEFWLGCEEE